MVDAIRYLCRVALIAKVRLFWILSFMLCTSVVHAQQQSTSQQNVFSDQPALSVAFGVFPPYSYFDAKGGRTGFSVELAEALGQEIGIAIEYADFESARAFVQALNNGTADMFPGIAQLPALQDNIAFSDPVATEVLRLMTTTAQRDGILADSLEGLRIGVIPPAVGSEIDALMAVNTAVAFATPDAALMALLAGELDGILAPNPTLFLRARNVGFDSHVSFLDPPVRTIQRFVAVHQSRADLMPAINQAIARMQSDGRLAALRAKYFIDLPPPPPAVLTVGVPHIPPHMIVQEDGGFSGFNVDVLRDLAALADLQLRFTAVPVSGFLAGPNAAGTDLLSGLTPTPKRREATDFSLAFRRIGFSAVVRASNPFGINGLDDLSGRRVGLLSGSFAERIATSVTGAQLMPSDKNGQALLDDLLAGELDVFLLETNSAIALVSGNAAKDLVRVVAPPLQSVGASVGLRFGLGSIRDRLDGVIPGYLLTTRYAALRAEYYGTPIFWTSRRVHLAGGAVGLIVLVLLIALAQQWLTKRRTELQLQRRALEQEQAYNRELSALVSQLQMSNREQAEFSYAISHDLKSPSNTIGMLISELEEMPTLDADVQSILTDMATTNRHMGQLVDDVLEYSRIVGKEMSVERVDLQKLLAQITKDLASDISGAQATITLDALPVLTGNRMQLRLLFQNLISNAVKFRVPGQPPVVEVRVGKAGAGVQITVADNGIGIAEKFRDRVFGLFQRLNTTSSYEGTGLGLTICQRVMANHKGNIHIGAGLNGGTAVSVTFPEDPSGAESQPHFEGPARAKDQAETREQTYHAEQTHPEVQT